MKFSLTVSDMTEEEYLELSNKINKTTMQVNINLNDFDTDDLKDDDNPWQGEAAPKTAEEELQVKEQAQQDWIYTHSGVDPNPPELDARGFPWDERIHAGTKTKNKDGTWKYKRGVTDEEKLTVEGELEAVVEEPKDVLLSETEQEEPRGLAPPPVIPSDMQLPEGAIPASQPVVADTTIEATTETITAQEIPADVEFATFTSALATGFREKKIEPSFVAELIEKINAEQSIPLTGVSDMTGISANQAAINFAYNELQKVL